MRDVTLVEVDPGGEHLILQDADGSRVRLRIDDELRSAVRRDIGWLQRLQSGDASPLRPRDIQARIRAGMTAAELARACGMPLEHIQRYEGPVLAEREHVVTRAQKLAVARSATGDTTLSEAIDEGLKARGVEAAPLWDSWREDAGTWIVQVSFEAGGRPRAAQWRCDLSAASLTALDDESRWLTREPEPADQPNPHERVFDVEADGGVREVTTDRPHVHEDAGVRTLDDPQARTLDLLDALRGRRGRRQPVDSDDDQPDLVDALLDAEGSLAEDAPDLGDPPPAHPPASRPADAVDAAILPLPEKERGADTDALPAESPTRSTRRRGERASRRASVPSWDDIMFGVKKD
ncbi:MAG: septation protein SepH [Actinomycetales bacterium]